MFHIEKEEDSGMSCSYFQVFEAYESRGNVFCHPEEIE